MAINAEYQKWYDRFTKGIATKEKHIDVLLEKGVITQEEYDSIIVQSGYVERTVEPIKVPTKLEQLETKVRTIETGNTDLNSTNSMLLLQVATLGASNEELSDMVVNLNTMNSMLLLQIAELSSKHQTEE